MAEERDHHPLSPSNWPAWTLCPFHEGIEKSDAATSGTKNHEELEKVLKGELDADLASASVSYAARRIIGLAMGNEIHTEDRLEIMDPLSDANGIFGYADAWWIDDRTIHVADYKSGSQNELPHAVQLMGYAYAIWTMYGDGKTSLDDVRLHVVYGADFNTVEYSTTIHECVEAALDAIRRKSNPSAYANHISHACAWCKHCNECDAVRNAIENFDKEITAMNDTQKLEHFSKITAIIKAETDRIKDSISINESITSDGIVYTKKHCDGKATGTDIVHLVKLAGENGVTVTADEIIPVCSVSKKAWTDLIKARAKSAGVKAALLGDWYAECSTFGEGFDKLVRSEVK